MVGTDGSEANLTFCPPPPPQITCIQGERVAARLSPQAVARLALTNCTV